ncbi:efflux RND transporter periplasmic adaptor subunit [Rubripirellula obstinata]|nr:efflux RND transporter periplasmic adaptor subunit [Rubripirellula obstinata]
MQTSQNKSWTIAFVAVLLVVPTAANAETIEAFTEPYLRVALPSPENGVIEKVLVKEGDSVTKKQMLAKLDDAVLRSSLELALAARNATGALEISEADVEMKQQQLDSYRTLQKNGNATPRELARSEMELSQANARLQSVREEQELRHLEYQRVKQQIRQRHLESPIQGVVIAIEKQVGEFVSMTDPVVMQIVQLDALKAVFSVPRRAAIGLESGQMISLDLGYDGETCPGEIVFVSPIANPESNTVRVKVRIANGKREIPSGVTCRWTLPSRSMEATPITTQVSRR